MVNPQLPRSEAAAARTASSTTTAAAGAAAPQQQQHSTSSRARPLAGYSTFAAAAPATLLDSDASPSPEGRHASPAQSSTSPSPPATTQPLSTSGRSVTPIAITMPQHRSGSYGTSAPAHIRPAGSRRRSSHADWSSMPISVSLLTGELESEAEMDEDVCASPTEIVTPSAPLLAKPASDQPAEVINIPAAPHHQQHPCHQEIFLEEEDLRLSIIGYHFILYRLYLYYFLCVATGGVLFLLGKWIPRLWVAWVGRACPMGNAEWVVVENSWGEASIEKVSRKYYGGSLGSVFGCTDLEEDASVSEASNDAQTSPSESMLQHLHYFDYRYIRFIYHPGRGVFMMNSMWKDSNWRTVADCAIGLGKDCQMERLAVFGPNVINIEEKSITKLMVEEVLHPFYIFQIFSMILWFYDDYLYYAACIFLISALSIISTLLDTKRNMRKMRDMSRFVCDVLVFRDQKWILTTSDQLVPGDLFDIAIPSLNVYPCDALLLSGDAIVNESMLTGESVPVPKYPVNDKGLREIDPSALNIPASLAKHVLFAGTRSIRVRGANLAHAASARSLNGISVDNQNGQLSAAASPAPVSPAPISPFYDEDGIRRAPAMVLRTGFNTTKGALVRSMMFPRPNKFQFYRDSFRFIGVLSVLAMLGFIASLYNFIRMGVSTYLIIVRALDLITIVVPPALPATMSIGTGFAIARLRKAKIFCISPPRVNIAGKLNVMCFDKTGTLTEEGLDVLGVRYAERESGRLSPLVRKASDLPPDYTPGRQAPSENMNVSNSSAPPPILRAITTCHSLKHVNGELIGDPLDLKMFDFTRWSLDEDALLSPSLLSGTEGASPMQAAAEKPIAVVHPPQDTVPHSPNRTRPRFRSFGEAPNGGGSGFAKPQAEISILREFEFISRLRRMAVVTLRRSPGGKETFEVFVKGAPEVMNDICDPTSFPDDYRSTLLHYTHHGYRVIACASKELHGVTWDDIQCMKRDQIESDLQFVGIVIFENKLKEGTASAVSTLRAASIRQVMCTGDNTLTAVSVSRECGLILPHSRVFVPRFVSGSAGDADAKLIWETAGGEGGDELGAATLMPMSVQHGNRDSAPFLTMDPRDYDLAVSGDAFRFLVDFAPIETLNRMLVKAAIFARMSPDDKHELVEKLHELGYVVGFCGDGANDCGALKAADVGISLSEAEASVAAPFTSQTTDIGCVIKTIREGRAALVTSFSCFKYMALYSLIQFTTVTFLYIFASNLGDFQFLYIDLFLIIPIAVLMGHTGPHESIHPKGPTASLVSKKVLSSLFGHVTLQCLFQWGMYRLVGQQPWYTPPVIDPAEKNIKCFENTTLFLFSSFQYMLIAIIFSVGAPYRKKMISNVPYIVATVGLILLTAFVVVSPTPWILDLLELEVLPKSWRLFLMGMVALYFALAWLGETLLFPRLAGWYSAAMDRRRWRRRASAVGDVAAGGKTHRKVYKQIERQLGLR